MVLIGTGSQGRYLKARPVKEQDLVIVASSFMDRNSACKLTPLTILASWKQISFETLY
jgi:hypothetical protein